MGFIRSLFGLEPKMTSLEYFKEVYGGRESMAGTSVSWKTAVEVATVLACVRILANGIAQVPWKLYREENGSRNAATDHPLYELLHRRPNGWQTSYEFRETIAFHIFLTGNAFVFVNRIGTRREVRELIPIEPGRVEVEQRDDYSLRYKIRNDKGSPQEFAADSIWHLRGPSWNSWQGMESVKLAREAIGLTQALERGQAEFQKNGASSSGNYAVQDKLSPERFEFLAKWLDRHQPGGDRYGKPLITDMGAKYSALVMSAVDQQLIESRKMQIEEICRVFGVMPLMVGHPADMAARAATQSIFLTHVVHGLMPHYSRLEQSADVNLLSQADLKAGYYTKFVAGGLMRGALSDQAEYFGKALGAGNGKGWMTQNEVRATIELDRSEDPEADKLPQPPVKPSTTAADRSPKGD